VIAGKRVQLNSSCHHLLWEHICDWQCGGSIPFHAAGTTVPDVGGVVKRERALLSTNDDIEQCVICSVPDMGMSGVLVPFTFNLWLWEKRVKHSRSHHWSNRRISCQASQVVLA